MKRLFIVVAATLLSLSAMADKTYVATERATSLEVGQKYIIYNTTMPLLSNGSYEDRTGVIYDAGGTTTNVSHLRCSLTQNKTNRPIFTDKHIITIEEGSASNQYRFKTTLRYINSNGTISNSPCDVKVEKWAESSAQKNTDAKSLLHDGTKGVADPNTTWVISNITGTGAACWNGNPGSFALWEGAHPYVFYKVVEAEELSAENIQYLNNTATAYLPAAKLQEMCYQLHNIYGYGRSEGQFTSNFKEPTEGSYANLIDNNTGTFFHSNWSGWNANTIDKTVPHNLQLDFKKNFPASFYIITGARTGTQTIANRPKHVTIEVSDNATDWTKVAEATYAPTDNELFIISDVINNKQYSINTVTNEPIYGQHLRYTVHSTTSNGDNIHFFSLGEFYVIWKTDLTEQIINNYNLALAELAKYPDGTSKQLNYALTAITDGVTELRNTYTAIDEIEADKPAVEQPEITVDLMGRKVTNIEGRRTIKKGNVTIVL